jgi:hypothetical protein
VNGFPTIMVIDKNKKTEYDGPRNEMEVWETFIHKSTM